MSLSMHAEGAMCLGTWHDCVQQVPVCNSKTVLWSGQPLSNVGLLISGVEPQILGLKAP